MEITVEKIAAKREQVKLEYITAQDKLIVAQTEVMELEADLRALDRLEQMITDPDYMSRLLDKVESSG